jgi:hypothetical protein
MADSCSCAHPITTEGGQGLQIMTHNDDIFFLFQKMVMAGFCSGGDKMHRTRAGLATFPENDNGWVHGRTCLVTLFEVG